MLADAFTNAFVYVKVLEVRARMEECVECECTSDGPTCGGPLLNASCSRVPGKRKEINVTCGLVAQSDDSILHIFMYEMFCETIPLAICMFNLRMSGETPKLIV